MVAKKKQPETGTEVVDWEEEMARQAQVSAGSQRSSGGGGKFFSLKAGQLSFDDNPLPGNQMAVIILADIMENSWFEGAYDPSTPMSPKCFAFGHDEDDMEPHEAVDKDPYFERQSPECSTCPLNEWGSAEKGRGKACKNVMRLSMIPAGIYKPKGTRRNQTFELELFDEESHYAKAEPAFMKLPVTSVKNYSKYVKALSADLARPPHGVITNIYLEPDPKAQFRVMFELIDRAPKELLKILVQRHSTELAAIDFPYSPPMEEEEREAARANNKLRGQKGAKARGRK